MQKNVFAYTEPGFEPSYISINDVDGQLQISVRSHGAQTTSVMTLPFGEIVKMVNRLKEYRLQMRQTPEDQAAHEHLTHQTTHA